MLSKSIKEVGKSPLMNAHVIPLRWNSPVSFKNGVKVVLIPQTIDYKSSGIFSDLWYGTDEIEKLRVESENEIRSFMKSNRCDSQTAKRALYQTSPVVSMKDFFACKENTGADNRDAENLNVVKGFRSSGSSSNNNNNKNTVMCSDDSSDYFLDAAELSRYILHEAEHSSLHRKEEDDERDDTKIDGVTDCEFDEEDSDEAFLQFQLE